MRQLNLLFLFAFLLSCNSSTKNQQLPEMPDDGAHPVTEQKLEVDKKEEVNPPPAQKIDLDSALVDEFDDHLTDFREGVLGLCCYDGLEVHLNYDYFEKSTEKFEVNGQQKVLEIYQAGESILKRYYNDHPKVMDWNLEGRITDNEAIINGNIRIGMAKTALLDQLFAPNPRFEEIKQLDIYEDEMGDKLTSFRFEGDSLKEILFD